jgi:hypothetical protein
MPTDKLCTYTIAGSGVGHPKPHCSYRYTSRTGPLGAAHKACRRIFTDIREDPKEFTRHTPGHSIEFILRELNTDKDFSFEGWEKELKNPKTVVIDGHKITHKYEYPAKRLFKHSKHSKHSK